MYILLLILYISGASVAIDQIEGFTTLASCTRARSEIGARLVHDDHLRLTTECIKVN